MFENLQENEGEKSLHLAARMFYLLAVCNGIAAVAAFLLYADRPRILVLFFVVSAISSFASWKVARGVEEGRRWAKWLGVALAALSLPNIPVGTLLGVLTLRHLNRADKAGLFGQTVPRDEAVSMHAPSTTIRGAIAGGAAGLLLLLFLLLAIGRPDDYVQKLLLLVGGGAAIGAFAGFLFRGRVRAA
ncbi:MAG: hypothetical protein M3Q69_14925 [Acidobacteriota bacterium]|nr:hypothetical protein [Acidobacteriota bacterium]